MSNKIKKFDGGGEVGGSGFVWGLAQEMASPELGMISDAQYTDRIISMIEDGYYYGQTPEQLAADDLGLSVAQMNARTEDMLDSILKSQGETETGFVDESARLAAEGILKGKIAQAGVTDPAAQEAALNSAMESLEEGGSGVEAVKAAAAGAQDYVEELLTTAKDIIDKGYDATIGKLPEILTPEGILADIVSGNVTGVFEIGETGGALPGATSPIFGGTVGTVGGGTNVGIMTTGNAVLDAVIRAAEGGLDQQDIESVVGAVIADTTGIPTDVIDAGIGGAKEAINAAKTVVGANVTGEGGDDDATKITVGATTKNCSDGTVVGIDEACPEDITTLIGGDETETGDSTVIGSFETDPCDDPVYAATNYDKCNKATATNREIIDDDLVAETKDCSDPAYAAANPVECAVDIVEKDCSDPAYAAANPVECAVDIVEEKDCTDPAYAAANPAECGVGGGDPCDDPAYAASRPGECGVVGGDPCDDPAYAAANPAKCGVIAPPEEEVSVPTTSQGYRAVQTKPGELVDIEYLYDIAGPSIFAPTMEEEDKYNPLGMYSPYAEGGIVQDYDIEELIRLLESQRG